MVELMRVRKRVGKHTAKRTAKSTAKMVSLLFVLVGLMSLSTVQAEIYKWVDAEGQVHYSDEKPDDVQAEQVEVKDTNYESTPITLRGDDEVQREVVMYATSWCGFCAKARKFFRAKGIDYTEYDIENNPWAKRRYDEMGAQGIPVIIVDGKRINGYDESELLKIFK